MLNQKDNDFDDLFRRASERYPLRTDSADWSRMDAALDNPPPDLPEEGIDKDKRRKRRFIWLFLLFPLGGAGYFILHQAGVGREHHPQTVGVGQEQHTTVPSAAAGSQKDVASGTPSGDAGVAGKVQPGDAGGAKSDDAGKVQPGDADGAKSDDAGKVQSNDAGGAKSGVAGKAQRGTPSDAANDAAAKPVKPDTKSVRVAAAKPTRASSVAAAQPMVDAGKDRFAAARRGIHKTVSGKNRVGHHGVETEADKDVEAAAKVGTADANDDRGRVANYPVGRASTREDYLLTVNVEAPVIAKDSSKTKPKASAKQKSSYLYAGLLAAPDLSTVHFQSMKSVGTTFSLLLGYQFNKKWAVETGVSVDRKRYYTDAEYFNTSKVPPGAIQPNWDLKYLDGTCYMWEIPINVRYNFSQNERSKWFATAGLSTYLMTREDYNYNYDWYYQGQWGNSTKNWDWKTPSNYWFSIINLSVGYEHRLGGIGNLRIEPYLRVPLSGLGTGQLNILSAGLNIGITRRLW